MVELWVCTSFDQMLKKMKMLPGLIIYEADM